ncbi:hypothetical protein LOTGIDRAFT_232557 [Lottia gigantea]|uniref:Centrosomal protein kizuna n=1 Tax=Lottia gigantea TaxID=225164 RepID=V3ZSD0_LOTGI|nr:hypothetical protein LOTGIDRAFT_232557 [Lottia gigantea]ESO94328.1 hypothetical protein LOTGIDRAFT_232557 [Lottia gigantea]
MTNHKKICVQRSLWTVKDARPVRQYSEEERLKLENQLKTYFRSDQRLAKLKVVKLNNYWKKVCQDEQRSKERNEQLLREFERIDSHLASMGDRTEKLRALKKQYEESIERKYPNWRELVLPKPNPVTTPNQQEIRPNDVSPLQQSPEHIRPVSQPPFHSTPASQTAAHATATIPQSTPATHQSTPDAHQAMPASHQVTTSTSQVTSPAHNITPKVNTENIDVHDSPIRKDIFHSDQSQETNQTKVKVIEDDENEDERTGEVEEFNIQPVQNVSIQNTPTVRKSGSMDPDDDSEIDSDLDLPLSGVHQLKPSPEKKSSDKQGGDNATLLGTTEAVASIETEVASTSVKSGGNTLRAELTLTGILYLLKYVQDEFRDAISVEGYYRISTPSDSHQRSSIIQKANNGENLNNIDGSLISMVILEQLTLVVRNLVDHGLMKDELLMGDITQLTSEKIGDNLTTDACDLWDGLFNHFNLLVEYKVMEPKEVAAIFVPGLVAEGSPYQTKAYTVLVQLLEAGKRDDVTDASSSVASPHHNFPAKTTLQANNTVPPLKFGSLIDRPYSDEESSFFSNTTSRNVVPLNETDAYKNMLSGTRTTSHHHGNDEEDTDDDVEKQFASVLSPRTPKKSVLSPRLNKEGGDIFSPKKGPGLIHSARSPKGDDISETDSFSPSPSPVYIPTALDSSKGSTGYKLPKRTGVKIGSDLDTDTEIEIHKSTNQDQDDDFDFYN